MFIDVDHYVKLVYDVLDLPLKPTFGANVEKRGNELAHVSDDVVTIGRDLSKLVCPVPQMGEADRLLVVLQECQQLFHSVKWTQYIRCCL